MDLPLRNLRLLYIYKFDLRYLGSNKKKSINLVMKFKVDYYNFVKNM